MTTLREAAQQALEALEGVFEGDEKGAQYWTVTGGTYEAVECKQAIAALKAALEQPEQEPELQLDGMTPLQFALEELHAFQEATGCDTASEFRAALEQPEQEPVSLPCCGYRDARAIKWNPFNGVVQCHNCGQTYTHPPRREWRGLTEEEKRECAQAMDAEPLAEGWPELVKFARAIEQALKEKNA